MKIGLTLRRGIYGPNGDMEGDLLEDGWVAFFESLGRPWIGIPNNISNVAHFVEVEGITHLLFSGGEDAPPKGSSLYGTMRDKVESELLSYGVARQIPIFGVCRGLHMVNGYFGGYTQKLSSLYSPNDTLHKFSHAGEDHLIKLVDGEQIMVNSFHNNGVVASSLAAGFEILATADDGVIEATCAPHFRCWALQWHIERPGGRNPLGDAMVAQWLIEQT